MTQFDEAYKTVCVLVEDFKDKENHYPSPDKNILYVLTKEEIEIVY